MLIIRVLWLTITEVIYNLFCLFYLSFVNAKNTQRRTNLKLLLWQRIESTVGWAIAKSASGCGFNPNRLQGQDYYEVTIIEVNWKSFFTFYVSFIIAKRKNYTLILHFYKMFTLKVNLFCVICIKKISICKSPTHSA